MSQLTPPGMQPGPGLPPAPPTSAPLPSLPRVDDEQAEKTAHRRRITEEWAISFGIVIAWFTAAGVLGALIWVNVTTLPEYVRTATSGSLDEEQLSKQFSMNGWFLVIAVVGGLISGLALMLIRRRSPVAMIVMIALGSGLAMWLMRDVGGWWGPGDLNAGLGAAKLGERVAVPLTTDVNALFYSWTIAALVGSMLALWLLETASTRKQLQTTPTPTPATSPGAPSYYG